MSFSENSFIQWLSSQKNTSGIGDDMAVSKDADGYVAYAVDQVIEGAHFLEGENPFLIGRKLLARNLSDVAAMGMVPMQALVALNVADKDDVWLKQFYEGLLTLAEQYDVELIGGDTARFGKTFSASLTIIARGEKAISRYDVEEGDSLFVTGKLGNSFASCRHLNFIPRINEGNFLQDYANAMIDLSDGLSQDLAYLCQASGVSVRLSLSKIPLNEDASLQQALNEGEDYELLFAVPSCLVKGLLKNWNFETNLTEIGKFVAKSNYAIVDEQNNEVKAAGFDHLK